MARASRDADRSGRMAVRLRRGRRRGLDWPGGWLDVGLGCLRAAGLFSVLLPRSGPHRRRPGPGRAVAGRRPRDGGGRADRRLRRHAVAAGQHLPVAHGRARQPDAGGRACDAGCATTPAGSCRPIAARRATSTSTPRSRWTWAGGRSSCGRSSASWRAASSAACARVTWWQPATRFGVMKFGSRMDVFLPPDATLRVKVGDRVIGGVSVIARCWQGRRR